MKKFGLLTVVFSLIASVFMVMPVSAGDDLKVKLDRNEYYDRTDVFKVKDNNDKVKFKVENDSKYYGIRYWVVDAGHGKVVKAEYLKADKKDEFKKELDKGHYYLQLGCSVGYGCEANGRVYR